jgi:hypothetical protein
LKLDDRKEGMLRRRITFHSFRRFVKTTISDQIGSDFADYILGHKRDMGYYTKTEKDSIANYKKAMPYLTFTDYSALETRGKSIEDKLGQKDVEVVELKKQNEELQDRITDLERRALDEETFQKAQEAIGLLYKFRDKGVI